jgi:3-deoxy-7-phosphoheptulonate synthase
MPLENINIDRFEPLIAPKTIKSELPINAKAAETVARARENARNILRGTDKRLLVISGPCSIHDADLALEYASRLAKLAVKYEDQMVVMMRVYMDKPRTTVGWRGFQNDPDMDFTNNFLGGLRRTRDLMIQINAMGVPAATEWLDPFAPQYISDLIAWGAIGARTTESQTHRTMASGLSMPIGFKNSTYGDAQVAVDAIQASSGQHVFLGINEDGFATLVHTKGNPDGHVILRGGKVDGKYVTNYSAEHVAKAAATMQKAKLQPAVLVDCSHANSGYDHRLQAVAWNDVLEQKYANTQEVGSTAVVGMMIESHIHEGKQSIPTDGTPLKYGVSVTDACIGWEETESLLAGAFERGRQANPTLAGA